MIDVLLLLNRFSRLHYNFVTPPSFTSLLIVWENLLRVEGRQTFESRAQDQSVTYRYRNLPVPGFFHFLVVSEPKLAKNGTGKVLEPVSGKFGAGKTSRNRSDFIMGTGTGIFNMCGDIRNLVPKKCFETSIGKIWYRKKSRNRYWKSLVPEKVPVSVSKIFGTGKKYRCRLTFWVLSHTAQHTSSLPKIFNHTCSIQQRPPRNIQQQIFNRHQLSQEYSAKNIQ